MNSHVRHCPALKQKMTIYRQSHKIADFWNLIGFPSLGNKYFIYPFQANVPFL